MKVLFKTLVVLFHNFKAMPAKVSLSIAANLTKEMEEMPFAACMNATTSGAYFCEQISEKIFPMLKKAITLCGNKEVVIVLFNLQTRMIHLVPSLKNVDTLFRNLEDLAKNFTPSVKFLEFLTKTLRKLMEGPDKERLRSQFLKSTTDSKHLQYCSGYFNTPSFKSAIADKSSLVCDGAYFYLLRS